MTYQVRLLLLGLLLSLLAGRPASAQQFGYIDTEFILSKMPEYAQAQLELNKLSDGWQKDIEAQKKDLDKLYRSYQAEEVVLTETMKKKRQDEILKKRQEIDAYETRQFGYDGQLFKKRVELNKPAQDKIFEATEKVAKARKLGLIFDRNGDLTLIFASPTYDYTEFVLEELGLGSTERNQPNKGPVKNINPPVAPGASPNSSVAPSLNNTAPGVTRPGLAPKSEVEQKQ